MEHEPEKDLGEVSCNFLKSKEFEAVKAVAAPNPRKIVAIDAFWSLYFRRN